ncbi:MAG: hypothetical protein IKF58_06925, partial [Bacillus sp. (in: Bacteria)]|nr:hypothetical protein [Bacillus sp. (in: firmicutes)]
MDTFKRIIQVSISRAWLGGQQRTPREKASKGKKEGDLYMKQEQTTPLEIIRGSSIEPKEVEWLWYPYIPFGKVTIIQGD